MLQYNTPRKRPALMAFSFLQRLKASAISPTMVLLTPLKQHIGCCVVVPLLLKMLGGVALLQAFIRDPSVELIVLALFLPIAVYGILRLEDLWRARHAAKHAAKHDPCDHHCVPAPLSFRRRYAMNVTIAFVMAFALHVIFHQHG